MISYSQALFLYQFGYHFIDFGWCNLGNQIKDFYAYTGPILAVYLIIECNHLPFFKKI